ncbi:siderophore-interacting protein [Citricoccus sp. SGAir0253]|uniref:siderophore-interacting protein n=1 Tax=Citricoccus sp. SGAir0253 TaxID=2567881 RepID=UPI0010CCE999|nr:siderophore-interacting protein [Citricoccus sp. SGAir0253]QCU79058.1 siderophore-interacting protein [Citricoccus sp. SGAir0253]
MPQHDPEGPAPAARRPRQPKPTVVLEVVAAERLGPHLVRLTLGGEGFAVYQDKDATDKYVKLLFADPALGLEMPYDLEALRQRLTPEQMPVRRTYTVRSVDPDAGTLTIDFVVHGEDGLAGPWAAAARPGDRVCFTGPGGMYRPDPAADWHLLAGDESALPAIGAALEAMPADAVGQAIIEVAGPEDEIGLSVPAGITVTWLHRGGEFTPETTGLAAAVIDAEWREGTVQVFAHGEREMVKDLRRYLADVRGVDRRQMSLSAYWAHGRAEDAFQAEKREPIGQIFPEA